MVDTTPWCRRCKPQRVAWEDPSQGSMLRRFLKTAWGFTVRPVESSALVGSGSVGWALVFSALCLVVHAVGWFSLASAASPEIALGLIAEVSFAWLVLLPALESLLLRAMGAKVSFPVVVRTSAFTMAVWMLPLVGLLVFFVWGPMLRVVSLRAALQLTWPQALVAAGAAPILFLCALLVSRADLAIWVS
jgi:hypothetical protein